ncbi:MULTISPECIES: TetR/AcrR family transcriptional regulator [Actinomyces]|uniref:TetR/AcrR family transcriptional regulator n=1 Tax=Actinomyces bowdenii TaxID=131109 RepID=A0A853EHZ4_9ACTO|nr:MULTISPECIES: TetR family transcriptional regulator [Actinomyces]MBF0696755.1 TetR family transcriptional regulator [Actinomyces bowdenii]MDO5064606.1 TetR family transcriptional regulator [Actinomyces bowdenii]NYS68928.1 TetR/AcrR family transcriptional regulator [Actinomyces bowdenii]
MSPRGRRPAGAPDARQAILDSARTAFARDGYRASLRAVAREAGVDPALVHHYFKDRSALFLEAVVVNEAGARLDIHERLADVVALPDDELGEGIVRAFVSLWDGVGGERFAAVLRAAVEADETLGAFREFLAEGVLSVLAQRLSGDRPRLRAQLISSQLLGLGLTRWVARMDELGPLGLEEVVAVVGPTIQRYAVGDLPALSPPRT